MNTDKKENRILLKNTLFDIIVNHSYQGKVPPERVLSELLGVNRFTLRKSMDELISEGKLYRKPRKGTYILQLHTKALSACASRQDNALLVAYSVHGATQDHSR